MDMEAAMTELRQYDPGAKLLGERGEQKESRTPEGDLDQLLSVLSVVMWYWACSSVEFDLF